MNLKIRSNGKSLTGVRIRGPQGREGGKEEKKGGMKEDASGAEEKEYGSVTEQRELTIAMSKREGVLKNLKLGISQNFAAPFGLAIGISPTIVAFLTSVPQLVGAFFGLFTEKIIGFFLRRKKVMVYASYLESFTWLIAALMAVLALKSPLLLIILVTLDVIFINIWSPIWTAIISDTVPGERLGKYIGLRNILTGTASLTSMILAGLILNWFAGFQRPLLGFGLVFLAAFVAAFFGASYQSKMTDPNPLVGKTAEARAATKYSFREFITTIRENNFGMFTSFYSLFQLVVNIVSPFYAIYMLEVLHFNYLMFTIITLASAISALLTMSLWGKLTDRYGSKRIFSITSFFIVASPLFWMTTTNWAILAVIEFCSGIVWAGFNLSCSAFMFESVKTEYKVKFYAYNKMLYGAGVFIGVLIGAIIYNLPPFLFSSTILWLLFVSGILRFVVAIIFIPLIQEEKVVTINFGEGRFHKHFITLRPRHGHSVEIFENREHPGAKAEAEEQERKAAQKKKATERKEAEKEAGKGAAEKRAPEKKKSREEARKEFQRNLKLISGEKPKNK